MSRVRFGTDSDLHRPTRGPFTIAGHGFFSCIKERRQNGSEPVSRIKEALVCRVANSVACHMSALMYWASCSASLCIRLRATPSKVRSISPGRPRSQSSTAISRGFRRISKNDGRHGTFEEDLQRCIFRGRRSTKNMFMRDVRRSGR